MTLQSSGAISLGNVNTELGRSATATISLDETAVRTLAGVSSGAISLASLYGKSNGPTFTPAGGASAGSASYLDSFAGFSGTASVTISCSTTAVWTWTRVGSTTATASRTSGASGTNITFSMNGNFNAYKTATFNVSATAGGITRYWTVVLETDSGN